MALQPLWLQKLDVHCDSRSSGLCACCCFSDSLHCNLIQSSVTERMFSPPSLAPCSCTWGPAGRLLSLTHNFLCEHLLSNNGNLKALSSPICILKLHYSFRETEACVILCKLWNRQEKIPPLVVWGPLTFSLNPWVDPISLFIWAILHVGNNYEGVPID